eukprot:364444-Chlamydomonas_euryale.AAC.5
MKLCFTTHGMTVQTMHSSGSDCCLMLVSSSSLEHIMFEQTTNINHAQHHGIKSFEHDACSRLDGVARKVPLHFLHSESLTKLADGGPPALLNRNGISNHFRGGRGVMVRTRIPRNPQICSIMERMYTE